MNKVSIGVFDSGLGGLSVVRALFARQPEASVIYFADIHHVPYGDRGLEEVRSFALGISDFLVEQGAGAVLMACNMSSAVALEDVRKRYPDVPVAGVIEAGARAALKVSDGPIGVLATAGTVKSEGYIREIAKLDSERGIIQSACPQFVPMVESGELEGAEVESAVREYLQPILDAGARTVILGCTHYPFLLPVLSAVAGPNVTFVDPAEEAVSQILTSVWPRAVSEAPSRYILSAPSSTFRPVGSRFLGRQLPVLELAQWNEADRTLHMRTADIRISVEAAG